MTMPGRIYLQRRRFLEWFGGSTLSFILPAPTGPQGASDPESDAIQISDSDVLIDLDAMPALAEVPGFLSIPSVQMVVVRAAEADFRAFRSVCSHAGCSVDGPPTSRLICPCHCSEYDLDGVPIAGPAPMPLDRFGAEFLADLGVVRVNRKRFFSNRTLVDRINGSRVVVRADCSPVDIS